MPREMTYQGETRTVSDAHPATDELPWNLDGDDFPAMIADMRAAGFDPEFPIFRSPEGFIVNGRRREFAALLAGVEPVYREVDWSEDEIVRHVKRTDLNRRHLAPGQRAAVAVALADLMPQGGDPATKGKRFPLGKSAADIAGEIKVSEKTVDAAAKVKKKAPELLDAVKEGKLSAHVAAKAADLSAAERKAIAESADPKKEAKAKTKAAGGGRTAAPASGPKGPEGAKSSSPTVSPSAATPDEQATATPPKPVKVIPPPAVDAWGIPVQPHAKEAFAAVPKFKELVAAITHAQRLFNEAAGLPGGKFLTLPDVSSYRRGKKLEDGTHADRFVHQGLERALQQVKAATPTHTVCPWGYVEASHPADCRTCLGLNWTPELGSNVPPAAVAAAKAAFGAGEAA